MFVEQYLQSVEDFTSCLQILKSTVDNTETDRSIAETHYNIGLACVYAGQYDDGVTHFRDAVSILEAKNAALKAVVSAAGDEDSSQEVMSARSEMKDIEELIPEIKLKVHNFLISCSSSNSCCFNGSNSRCSCS